MGVAAAISGRRRLYLWATYMSDHFFPVECVHLNAGLHGRNGNHVHMLAGVLVCSDSPETKPTAMVYIYKFNPIYW